MLVILKESYVANEKNLIPLNKRCKEAAKRIQRKGGKVKAAKAKEIRTLKETIQLMLSMKPAKTIKNFKTFISSDGTIKHTNLDLLKEMKAMFPKIDPKNIDNRAVMAYVLMRETLKGNIKAIEVMRDSSGETIAKANDLPPQINIQVVNIVDEKLKKIYTRMEKK